MRALNAFLQKHCGPDAAAHGPLVLSRALCYNRKTARSAPQKQPAAPQGAADRECNMSDFFCKLLTPWNAGALFDTEAEFHAFLLRRNQALNTIRVILFAVAAVCLLLSYATDRKLWNYIAVGALVLALGVTLLYGRNEKELPDGLREK